MAPGLELILDVLQARRHARAPFLVGLTGAVAVGKSALAAQLQAASPAAQVAIVGTDGFLFDNATLEARGLLGRKGFPESYDAAALAASLAAIRAGPAEFPGYSHVIYDVDPALSRRIDPPQLLIVEGLGLQLGAAALGLDALIYLEADEAHVEAWFTARFMALWQAAETDPVSFYRRFRSMSEPDARRFAGQVWRAVNLPNLREHIAGARALADIIVRKGPDHQILEVVERP